MLRQHEIFLDVDESFRSQSAKFVEVARETLPNFFQKLTDRGSFVQRQLVAVTGTVPLQKERERDNKRA
jgi:hypothetical protein